jgi:hypothetical protein
MKNIPNFEDFINESVIKDNLEMVGPDVNELLDAINKLNGAQLSGKSFKHRDNVRLNPVDKTGHVVSNKKYSIEVIPEKIKGSTPDTNTYLRDANSFLEEIGLDCKLYKVN